MVKKIKFAIIIRWKNIKSPRQKAYQWAGAIFKNQQGDWREVPVRRPAQTKSSWWKALKGEKSFRSFRKGNSRKTGDWKGKGVEIAGKARKD